ncbi:MAG: hypothetical protein D6798_01170 [Deltaproteobacteria bacterium]|nr:MAG: hypothetical protein D6798_01170 [Deltaproteobacteria bacterium]
MPPTLTLALLLAACTDKSDHDSGPASPSSATWLQGAGYSWELFNHRVSHVEWGVGEAGAETAIIGGTSTTGVSPDLPDDCDPDTCDELPFRDDAAVTVRWVRATSSTVSFTTATASLVVGADGGEASVAVDLPDGATGDSFALLRRLALDTDQPLTGGEACYTPAYGWHPRRIFVELGTPVATDGGVSIPVRAGFDAGESLEEIRQCIDKVNEQAQVAFTVEMVVVTTPAAWDHQDVRHSMSYTYGDGPANPDEQPDPDLSERPLALDLDAPLVGWSRLDWRFMVDDPDGRGAYIRSLSFDADADQGYASGHATNYSPITQLTGFDYTFEGTVVGFELPDGEADRGTAAGTVPAELDDEGRAVVQVLGW